MKGGVVMKRIASIGILMFSFILILTPNVRSAVVGPGELPSWHEDAQLQLGWIFNDPTNPQNSVPIESWDKAIGNIPTWSFDPGRVAWGNPGQWAIRIPNLINDNPVKHFWLSWVYEFDVLANPRTYTSIDWSPDNGFTNLGVSDVWFQADGMTETTDINLAVYGRMTIIYDLYPNPEWEDIWLGLDPMSVNNGFYVTEVYVKTFCTPIPGAVWLLGSGLIGLIGCRRKLDKD
jgi:hypothetical protein